MISPFQSLVTRLSAVFGRIGPQPPRQRWGVSARAAIWYCKAVLWLFGAPLVIGALLSYFSYKSILVYQYHTCTIWQPYGIARSFYGCIVHISFGSACDRCTTLVYYHTCTIWQPYGIARPFYGAPLVYHMIGALLLHLVHYYHTFMYYHTSLFYMQGRSMVACYHLVL